MSMPLDGIRIVDWTLAQQGPAATQMLADLGAEVIKIEQPVVGEIGRGWNQIHGVSMPSREGRSFYFDAFNRNKKSITVDLKKEKGREVIYRLVEKSDVFVQNFKKGVAARLGMGYETLSRYNPRLVYASASGYGPEGTEAKMPAVDNLGLARSGIMTTCGEPDMPPLYVRGAIADQVGSIMLAFGILTALMAKERQGIGQELDTSLLGSMIALQSLMVSANLFLGHDVDFRVSRAKAPNPLFNNYKCADERWICLGMAFERYWDEACKALGIEELKSDARFESVAKRKENCEELVSILDKLFATKSCQEWLDILRAVDLPATPVNKIFDLASDPQVLANGYITNMDHPVFGDIKVVGLPVKLSKTPGAIRTAAPEMGQHTEEVLLDICGYSWEEIEDLHKQEVI